MPQSRTAVLLIGAAATEDRLKSQVEGKQVVHLATHGFLEGEALARTAVGAHPLPASGLALAGANAGLGPLRAREGVQGLRRCFQGAGAATVITTLWRVEDAATRGWMKSLYDARLRGQTTAESMRLASLEVIAEARRKNESPHPYFWGGFVAFGDWR